MNVRIEPQHGQPASDHGADPPRGATRVTALLTTRPLDLAAAQADVADDTCGGIGLFAGVVRNHHEGDAVAHLEYEAWEEQAQPALEAVGHAVLEAHPSVRAVHLAHRLGRLEVGEVSVVVAASAPHRAEAIHAAHDAIDRLKASVPIWKHEHLADGTSRWPGC